MIHTDIKEMERFRGRY